MRGFRSREDIEVGNIGLETIKRRNNGLVKKI